MKKRMISLIGMPSAGKTAISTELASRLGYTCFHLDEMVEALQGETLISILEKKGGMHFLDIEYDLLLKLDSATSAVISPAGSIIYHDKAVEWLKKNATVVFIDTPLEVIEKRLAIKPKAIVGLKEKGLKRLAEERIPVYAKIADIIIHTEGKDLDVTVDEIVAKLSSFPQ